MKTFLNVTGILALVGGLLGAGMSGTVWLIPAAFIPAALCFGLARLIDLGETHLERTSTQRLMEREYWEKMSRGIPKLPPDSSPQKAERVAVELEALR